MLGVVHVKLVDLFAKVSIPPYSEKLWYEYVVKNVNANAKSDSHLIWAILYTFDKAVDPKKQFLQIDEFFENIQEKDIVDSLWSNRIAHSFMDYLLRKGEVEQSYLLAFIKNGIGPDEREVRFSTICTLITNLDTYREIVKAMGYCYDSDHPSSYNLIPIFDIDKLSKDPDFEAKQQVLFKTLVDLKLDELLRNSVKQLNEKNRLIFDKIPEFNLNEFHQTKKYVLNICSQDLDKAYSFLSGIKDANRLKFLKDTDLSDCSKIVTISSLNKELLKVIDAKGKYDKIKEYKVDSPEFEEILELNFNCILPNLSSVIFSKIENATDEDIENISMDNKMRICFTFITYAQTSDEKRAKNIKTLMRKNAIPSSFSFPYVISDLCVQAIIDNVNENNINGIILANTDSVDIFQSLIKSSHLHDVTPLVISGKFSKKQLEELDAQEKYTTIPDPTSDDFEALLKIAVDSSLCKLIERLKISLINTGIDRITNTNILRIIFTRCAFAEILDRLDGATLIKISESYPDAIKNCPDAIFTKNALSLLQHAINTSNSSFC